MTRPGDGWRGGRGGWWSRGDGLGHGRFGEAKQRWLPDGEKAVTAADSEGSR